MKITLTEKQTRQLQPFFDQVRATAVLGSPGILLGQIRWDAIRCISTMDVGFFEHESAKSMIAAAKQPPP
jgi:hypothetical protein